MTWNVYKVVFRMESPLHSGWMKAGNVQRTRLYVTGRMMWGALTANITRMIGDNYSEIGEDVKKHLIASYFFPCFDKKGEKLALPFYDENRIKYNIGKSEFTASIVDRALITSYNSTSIDPNKLSAEDASLHEIELLNNKTIHPIKSINPNDKSYLMAKHTGTKDTIPINSNIYLMGYIFESSKTSSKIRNKWQNALKMVQLGGKRTYGFGCLHLEEITPETLNIFGYNLVSKDDKIKLELNKGKQILAHAFDVEGLSGVLEPFFGRNTDKKGRFGEEYSSSVKVSWSPGSILNGKKIFEITDFGLWKGVS